MDVFQAVCLILLVAAAANGHGSYSSGSSPDFFLEPSRIVVNPNGGVITINGYSNVPLRSCTFVLPNKQMLDFSLGRNSTRTRKHRYHGRGLEKGDCGLHLTYFYPELLGLSGLIECRIRKDGSEVWESSVTTVRVTALSQRVLPVFEVKPMRSRLQKGDNITMTCNARRPIDFCHFTLPGGRQLNLDMGQQSPATPEHRYHGAGLQTGACGVTLIRVDERMKGDVICKVGRRPADKDGPWDIGAMRVIITGGRTSGSVQPAVTTVTKPSVTPVVATRKPAVSTAPAVAVTTGPAVAVTTPAQPTVAGSDCGKISSQGANIVPLINFGQETYPGQWPWHVAIYRREGAGGATTAGAATRPPSYACGGSLISLRVVLTAGHCLSTGNRALNVSAVTVYAGKYYLLNTVQDEGRQERKVRQIILHPLYDLQAGLVNDIALAIVETPFIASSFVKPVCLWDSTNSSINTVVGKGGIVTGWGRDENGELTEELMMAMMPVVSFETCIESNPEHFSTFVRQTTYCAGFRNGTSACNGDSGGGMVFSTRRGAELVWHLRGVVSNSLRKENELVCDPLNYVVFTDVAQYGNWITNNTRIP